MKKTRRSRQGNSTFIFVLIAAFAVSVGMSYFFMKEKFSFDSAFIDEIESRPVGSARKEQKKETPKLYPHQENGPSPLPSAEDAVRKYLRDHKVRLLDLYMDNGGVVYVDMGDELKKNFRGDASEELRTFAGLYRSIEAVVPDLTAVKVLMEGHETETIGGHIDLSKPLGKEIAEDI